MIQYIFWPQGFNDLSYLESLAVDKNRISILSSNIDSFNSLIDMGNIDYIGTRLHGGIRALQKKLGP